MSVSERGPHEPIGSNFTPHEAPPKLNQAQIQESLQNSSPRLDLQLNDDLFDKSKTRRLFANLTFTLEDVANNPNLATWKLDQDSWKNLQVRPEGAGPSEPRRGDLSKAVILSMKVMRAQSELPFAAGVLISGVSGNAYSKKTRAPYFMAAKENFRSTDGVLIHQIKNSGISAADIVYGNATEANLNKMYTPFSDDASKSLVLAGTILSRTVVHPHNLRQFGVRDPENYQTAHMVQNDKEFYCVDTVWVRDSIKAILEEAAGRTYPTTNLFQFSVGVQHVDGIPWSEISSFVPHIDEEDYIYQMKQPRHISVELEMTYLPELSH